MAHEFQFNEEETTFVKAKPKKSAPGIIGWLMKKGIVKTPQQANIVLILFIVIGLIGIIYINYRTFVA